VKKIPIEEYSTKLRLRGHGGGWLPFRMVLILLILISSHTVSLGATKLEEKRQNERIKAVVDRLRGDLLISEEVFVSIVSENKRLVSVERSKVQHNAFLLSFDENFLNTLSESELTAAIAHELGHVWIFTHHPYLHTELLANQVALKVVPRESLERVYEKVWKGNGTKVGIEEFLGE
jgi:hypothetical protein